MRSDGNVVAAATAAKIEKEQEMIIAYDFNNYRLKHDWIDKNQTQQQHCKRSLVFFVENNLNASNTTIPRDVVNYRSD